MDFSSFDLTLLTNGLTHWSFWKMLVFSLITTHISVICVTVYLHRCQAHRALNLHPIISHFMRGYLWLTTGMVTKEWVSIHRKHHVHSDESDDPHSPQVEGLPTVLFSGTELYRAEAKNEETLARYGQGTPDDWIERHLYTPYSGRGVVILLITYLTLFGFAGLAMWAIQMMWLPFWAAGVVNGVGHFFGYRNYECSDEARNIMPLGLIMGGEELHNNHHTYPTSPKLSLKWFEFDIAWGYITLFKWLGLAKIRKEVPKLRAVEGKSVVDDDTLRAVITNRFEILSHYTHTVVMPVFRQEKAEMKAKGQRLISRAKRLLIKEPSLVAETDLHRLNAFLKDHSQLQLVVNFRNQLQSIWERTMGSNTQADLKELLEALQEWCKQAEATGIEVLHDFAAQLKTFSLQPEAKLV